MTLSDNFRNCVGIEFVWINPGSFSMGAVVGDIDADENEFPCHPAAVTRGFYMATTPITLEQYRRLAIYEARDFGAWDDQHAVKFYFLRRR